jgi:succinyl-diaminopimelate desuccinylase
MRRLPLNDEASKLLLLLDNTLCNKTDGSGVGLDIKDDISGALTLNVGIISLENGLLSITLDVRYPVTFEADLVRSRLAAAFNGFSITDEHIQHPHHTPEDHFLVKALKKVYQKNTGQEAQCLAIGGGTYARALKTGVAFGVTRPGAPEMAHNCDERMSIDDFIADAHMFADAYLELVSEV